MADIRISELAELQNVEDNDVLVINDTSAVTTKKITRLNFLSGITRNVTDSGDNAIVNQDLTVNNDLIIGGNVDMTGDIKFGSLTDIINDITTYGFITAADGIENYDSSGYIPTTGAVIAYVQNTPVTNTFDLSSTSGSTNYTFSDTNSVWFPTAENDPVLYLRRGETYRFTNVPVADPLEIRDSDGGTAYSTGVTNNGGSGTVVFAVSMSAPSSLYYQSTANSAMGNTINIV